MRVAILYTGGKDSCYAMYRAVQQGREVVCLVTLKSENPSSYMFHTANIDFVKTLHSKALNIPIIFKKTRGLKEAELKDLKAALQLAIKKYKIEGVVSGAIVGGFVLGMAESVGYGLIPGSITYLLIFCAVILLLAICPQGIMGKPWG